MSTIIIYTDGACSGNPGPGGWGAILQLPSGEIRELGGHDPQTTNNRMELLGAIEALRAISISVTDQDLVELYTDSKYVINGITEWVSGWKARGWKKADKKDVLNRDLWETLDQLANAGPLKRRILWKYVAGHSGNPGNDRCDKIAVTFSKGSTPDLFHGKRG